MNEYKLKDMIVGLTQSFSVDITNEMMDLFLRLSGDNNPLHIQREFAKGMGFSDRVVYGMLTSSFYSTLAGVYLPGKYCLLTGIDVSFHKPVYVGDRLTITGEIEFISESTGQVEMKARILNQKNEKVSKSKIKFSLLE
ncbi:MaoC/PaaZ C-terminal domain-containing protein [Candidatus Magnetominusculus xianensis]|uniref:Dehydratase n=1 Tax=Candidatus Magnetominusculus xianensis TaxID=1748249 RepID=A0ABR5SHI1_9BACT|nr:MaoC/PaaZ C-terminal domain-containing protein [Candidatus Magnetominusculus xianensis]KWT91545.1 dehydratase [Candidatus Magnetominusculus xianensis]MBF0404331.1 MaoC family dehydratase N-terminal domain-containing protein [Nitrospirota bacterium]